MSKTSSGPRHFKISLVTGPVPGPTSKIRFGEVDSMAAAASDRAPTKFVPVDGGCGHDHSESAPPSTRMRPEELTSHYGREKDGTKL